MLLVIDVGNTNIAIGIYDGKILLNDWRIRTVHNFTEDELNVLIIALFLNAKIEIFYITSIIISSVVPSLNVVLNSFCIKLFKKKPYWVSAEVDKYMSILIENPNELGADRIVNAISGYSKYMKSLIIVDFGTATTFDIISSNGDYLGGAISPGIAISSEALFSKASKLSRIDVFTPPKCAIGKNTTSSIQSGIIFGYAGLVDGLVKRLSSEMIDDPLVVSTGGLAPLMSNVSETIEKIDLSLTLEGLRIINEKFNI